MKVLIEEVNIGTIAAGQKAINFWILARLENGQKIEIFDFKPFDLRGFENKYLNCLIFAWMDKIKENNNIFPITGKFIKNFEISSKWFESEPLLIHSKNSYSAVETINGVFLLDPHEYGDSYLEVNDGEIINFDGYRFDLHAWFSIQ